MAIDIVLRNIFKYYKNHPDFFGKRITNVNQKGIMDDALLHIAVRNENMEHIRLLVQYGADVNALGDMGYTPLHYAVWTSPELVGFLLDVGADKNIMNEWGKTPLDIARSRMSVEIVTMLEKI